MNFNVWNIKEMLSIPSSSGATKSSNWNNNQADGIAFSDSQFLFGSQFCPENSETLSAPLDFGTNLRHPKQKQQNSLDSEPSIFTKYQTKPQLFGGDAKDGGLFSLPLPLGKTKGLLKQFEDQKKRATEKCDSETLYNFVSHVGESIYRLQTSVEKSEEHLSSRSQSILDSLEAVAKTLQETARVQSDMLFEAVREKGNMEQAIIEVQKRLEARQAELIEMKSNLKHLEVLVVQQSKDFQHLCEQLGQMNVPGVLEELKRLISVPSVPGHVKDSTSQTSPLMAQCLSFTRHKKYTSEEPVTWQAQAPTASGNPSMGSLRTGELGVFDKRAKNDALQEEAALLAVGPHEEKGHIKDKAMQTDCHNWAISKTSPKNYGSCILDHKVCGERDLVSQRASQLTSLDLNNIATNIGNIFPKYQAQSMFSCDSGEQLTEQKGKSVERERKGKKQQPRKTHRGRLPGRKREQTPSKTCAFNSKSQSPQSPVSGPQGPPMGQQKLFAQPLHLRNPRSSIKPVCHVLEETVKPNRTAGAAKRNLLQFTRSSSQDSELLSSNSQGDHQIKWFSDLSLGDSELPLCEEAGKNLFYDLYFDSSDDDF